MSVAIRKIHRRAMVPLDVAVVVFFTVGFLFGGWNRHAAGGIHRQALTNLRCQAGNQ